ncbi:lysozyme inhibitor LprI family protein [Paraburkholderia caffeinilytica]|uniref:lysozyme inhibitor LprI family protein n=1 Tax=Paraburkholderia caffeinilytica TaxID=1761016 RepID=UPI003DA046A2
MKKIVTVLLSLSVILPTVAKAANDYQTSDRKLNETYSALLKKVSPQGGIRLRQAEQAWIAYRDAQCTFLTFQSGGYSAEPQARAQCLTRLTRLQTWLLDEQLHCKEGDIGCGQQ